jgi:hypothetical protein
MEEERSARSIALAAARDAIPMVRQGSSWLLDASEAASRFSYRATDTLASAWQATSTVGVVGSAALGTAGVLSGPIALGVGAVAATGVAAASLTRWGVSVAHQTAERGLSLSREAANAALGRTEWLLESYGVEEGATLRLFLGRDVAGALQVRC